MDNLQIQIQVKPACLLKLIAFNLILMVWFFIQTQFQITINKSHKVSYQL